ncbi:class I SAM-dependent methyltransferase [Nostoc sp. MG11]|uniref:class I SAM-dependent methyltransferase n=1 Tax=Nostoc sp. MG11 TaxID=2721166 RepID=UPI00186953D5|nr:class I SAM-dependent methyltransferase [Nostoc sp. MG11]
MNNQEQPVFFGKEQAAGYDQRWTKLAPIRDALHLLLRIRLSELPDDAQVLCVGVGTGAELLYLAQAFPQWSFTLVEPSKPMLDICRQRAEEDGITSRCTFHEGYLDSLPLSLPFDAATCLLVSQFIMQPEERRAFFGQMSNQLRPGGYLVSADLSSGASDSAYKDLFEVWFQMQRFNGMLEEGIEKMRQAYGRNVAVSALREIEALIASNGFDAPVLFFQAFLIRAWYARRTT